MDLPQADANPLSEEVEEPIVVSVTKAGDFHISVGDNKDKPISGDQLLERIGKVLRQKPDAQILVQGDKHVPYGKVMEAMVLIQQGGAPGVGLITDPPEK